MQGRNRDTEVENGPLAQWGGKGGMNREPRCPVLFTVCETAGRKLLYGQGAQPSDVEGRMGGEVQERGKIYVLMAESLC